MRHRLFLFAALLPGAAWAQGFQNREIVIEAGPAWVPSGTLAGTNVRLAGSVGTGIHTNYGYQVARASAARLMLDVSFLFAEPGLVSQSGHPEAVITSYNAVTAGLRLMVPVESRVTFFPVAGGGFGWFNPPFQGSTFVVTRGTVHGVFEFGGGADFRISRHVSLRAEVRNTVTGRQLSGASGRNHVLPLFGVAAHF
jgi:hypothetical protein